MLNYGKQVGCFIQNNTCIMLEKGYFSSVSSH